MNTPHITPSAFSDILGKAILARDFSSPFASFILPSMTDSLSESSELAKSLSAYQNMAIIGIGGSNLCTIAIHDALSDILPHEREIYFYDTPDPSDVERT